MHVVDDVPLLPASTPLMDALRAMRIHQRSAVVRESQSSWNLIQIPELFAGLVQQVSELSNIGDAAPVYRVSQADISSWRLDLNDPYQTPSAYERLLDSAGYSYALIKPVAGTVSIVTRHEPYADAILAIPRQCQCRGPLRHGFPLPHVSSSDSCPICGSRIDCF
jgi:hypothetical protein